MCKPHLIERVAAQQIAKFADIERLCRGQQRCSLALKQSPESKALGRTSHAIILHLVRALEAWADRRCAAPLPGPKTWCRALAFDLAQTDLSSSVQHRVCIVAHEKDLVNNIETSSQAFCVCEALMARLINFGCSIGSSHWRGRRDDRSFDWVDVCIEGTRSWRSTSAPSRQTWASRSGHSRET